jgi:hypothetical protein
MEQDVGRSPGLSNICWEWLMKTTNGSVERCDSEDTIPAFYSVISWANLGWEIGYSELHRCLPQCRLPCVTLSHIFSSFVNTRSDGTQTTDKWTRDPDASRTGNISTFRDHCPPPCSSKPGFGKKWSEVPKNMASLVPNSRSFLSTVFQL